MSLNDDHLCKVPGEMPGQSCMYCGSNDGHWERVHTGDEESYEGWEDWFCCHPCRDANQPCETFHRIPFPEEETDRVDLSPARRIALE